jgi:hypothetical protein
MLLGTAVDGVDGVMESSMVRATEDAAEGAMLGSKAGAGESVKGVMESPCTPVHW